MNLRDWMDAEGKTPESLSSELKGHGCRATGDLIRKVLSGKKRFGNDNIFAIQEISEGKVTFEDLYVPMADLKAPGV